MKAQPSHLRIVGSSSFRESEVIMPRATRPAGAPVVIHDDDPTRLEIEEALQHMSAAAREARARGNDILVGVVHRRIDDRLDLWEIAAMMDGSHTTS